MSLRRAHWHFLDSVGCADRLADGVDFESVRTIAEGPTVARERCGYHAPHTPLGIGVTVAQVILIHFVLVQI